MGNLMDAPRRRNRLWLWFLIFVVVASVGLAGFVIVFNMRLQLKPEQVADAIQRWKEHGPRDYLLTLTKQIGGNDQAHTDTFVVTVRDKKVIDVRMNGEPLRNQETDERYPPGHARLQWYSMDRMLSDVETFLERDAKAGVKNFNVAVFDTETGALLRYVRREMGTRHRVQEDVKLERLPP